MILNKRDGSREAGKEEESAGSTRISHRRTERTTGLHFLFGRTPFFLQGRSKSHRLARATTQPRNEVRNENEPDESTGVSPREHLMALWTGAAPGHVTRCGDNSGSCGNHVLAPTVARCCCCCCCDDRGFLRGERDRVHAFRKEMFKMKQLFLEADAPAAHQRRPGLASQSDSYLHHVLI